MYAAGTDLHLDLDADASSVAVARHAVSDFAAEAGADPEAVAVAVSEAVTNAVMHAYPPERGGAITVDAVRNGEGVTVIVRDSGRGMRPNPGSPGLGYGLALVASMADEIAIADSSEGGTVVRMRFEAAG